MPKKIILNEELFKIFTEHIIISTCVREITRNADIKLNLKYLENCCNYEANNKSNNVISCEECWRKFLTNDLMKIED